MDQDQKRLGAALQVVKEVLLGSGVEPVVASQEQCCVSDTCGGRKVIKPPRVPECCCPTLQINVILTNVVNIQNAACP